MNEPIIIIGGGPGGIAAAIQLYRSGYKPLIFESHQLGGLLVNAWCVENYPGFPEGISGLELVQLFREQLALYHPEIIYDYVLKVEKTQRGYRLTTQKDRSYTCKYLIIATGTVPKQYLKLKLNAKVPLTKRIHYEVDEISYLKGKDISIIGGSDAAFDYAMTMSQENQLSIFMRGSKAKAIKALSDAVQINHQIKVFPKTEFEDLELKNDRISLNYKTGASIQNHMTDHLLFAIGRTPTMPQLVNRKAFEYEKEKSVFFVGDVKNSQYRQVAFAVSDGIKAAMTIDCMIRGEQ